MKLKTDISFFLEVSLTYPTIIASNDYHNLSFAHFLEMIEAYVE